MTYLRRMMLEELRRRNYAESTIDAYIRTVEHFSKHFHRPPDQLGPEHIRQYQALLFTRSKLAPNTVTQRLAALRFFYVQVLKRGWSVAETPLSEEGSASAADTQPRRGRSSDRGGSDPLTSHLAHDTLCHRRTPRRGRPPEGQRYRQPANGHSYPRRQGTQGSRCHAQPQAAR